MKKLKGEKHHKSTRQNYYGIWKNFNKFLVKLDHLPRKWEERLTLYVGYLSDKGVQSSTLRSYISAIKSVLTDDEYEWDVKHLKLSALTRAHKLVNDRVLTKLPIQIGLMETIIFEIKRKLENQFYLMVLYKTIILLLYYGLFRIGELTMSEHVLKAVDVFNDDKEDKVLLVLRSSKTHGKGDRCQKIRLNSSMKSNSRNFCPIESINTFLKVRGGYVNEHDQLFVFTDNTPVKAGHVRKILKDALKALRLNSSLYGTHSLRSGRATDLAKNGVPVDTIKYLGRWRSNAVYKYIRDYVVM